MLGNLLLTLTAMIWGTAFVGQRVGMESIEPFTFNAANPGLSSKSSLTDTVDPAVADT